MCPTLRREIVAQEAGVSDGTGRAARISLSLPLHPQLNADLPKVSVSLPLRLLRVFSVQYFLSLILCVLSLLYRLFPFPRRDSQLQIFCGHCTHFVTYFSRCIKSHFISDTVHSNYSIDRLRVFVRNCLFHLRKVCFAHLHDETCFSLNRSFFFFNCFLSKHIVYH